MDVLTDNPVLLKAVTVVTAAVLGTVLFRSRRAGEPLRELVSKLLGGGVFSLYIGYRVAIQLDEYARFPDLFSVWSWVNWALIMMTFLFFLVAYLVRRAPVSAANRFREVVFPLFCASLPFFLYQSVTLLSGEGALSRALSERAWVRDLLTPFVEVRAWRYSPVSIVLNVLGHGLTLWGAIWLRGSFSIMAEARTPVLGGPYRWIRHPLYVGESVAVIGFCVLLPSWFTIGVTVLFCVCQRIRASVEEAKLADAFPAYREHMGNTGAYLPRWPGGR